MPIVRPINLTTNAHIQATMHCPMTIPTAQPPPSSLLMAATAATQGVYNKQNTSNANAPRGVIRASTFPAVNTVNVETTLSFAIKPAINAVTILQSPKPSGAKIGAMIPATTASMLV